MMFFRKKIVFVTRNGSGVTSPGICLEFRKKKFIPYCKIIQFFQIARPIISTNLIVNVVIV